MGKAIGLSRKGTISDWERGKALPETANLVNLAKVLDCSIDWLLTGEGPSTRRDHQLYAADRNSSLTQAELRTIIAKEVHEAVRKELSKQKADLEALQEAIKEELSKHPLRDEE